MPKPGSAMHGKSGHLSDWLRQKGTQEILYPQTQSNYVCMSYSPSSYVLFTRLNVLELDSSFVLQNNWLCFHIIIQYFDIYRFDVTQLVQYLIGRQADRQTGRQADRQTGRQADRQADRQTGRQVDSQSRLLTNSIITCAYAYIRTWYVRSKRLIPG